MSDTIDEYKRLFREATVTDQMKLFQLHVAIYLVVNIIWLSLNMMGTVMIKSFLGSIRFPGWMGSAGNCTLLVLCAWRREPVPAQGRDGGVKDQIRLLSKPVDTVPLGKRFSWEPGPFYYFILPFLSFLRLAFSVIFSSSFPEGYSNPRF